VNAILKDRMYRIKTSGYSCKDKIMIARKHILPKIIEQVRSSPKALLFRRVGVYYNRKPIYAERGGCA
jgi:ATP-dependent Lon protease